MATSAHLLTMRNPVFYPTQEQIQEEEREKLKILEESTVLKNINVKRSLYEHTNSKLRVAREAQESPLEKIYKHSSGITNE
jgi:hypothetical protein